ncbi:hypothetical protein CPC16_012166 [Podila verticillata]|nr:hypothetical protein CPC16_012166 [Podila verticillata]
MFNVTELDKMVCSQLDRKSLVHCAKVNRKWNADVGSLPLAKYGRFFRQVELSGELLFGLENMRSMWKESGMTGRSPSAGPQVFNTTKFFRLSLEILPRVNSLSIKGDRDGRKSFPASKLKQALTAASAHLHTLTINVPMFRPAKTSSNSVTHARTEPKITARPKRHHLQNSKTAHSSGVSVVKSRNSRKSRALLPQAPRAIAAVLKHAVTLEEFSAIKVQVSTDITRILKSSPKLRTETIEETDHSNNLEPRVSCTDFVDWDEEVKVILPWLCKDTLEALAIKIIDVPHWNDRVPYSGQGGYPKLFQDSAASMRADWNFTNLKTLQLATKSDQGKNHDACVQLSPDAGVDKLAGLKNLEKVHINKTGHRITEERDVKWMADHWPKLRRHDGLDRDPNAYKWLKRIIPATLQLICNRG